MTNPAYALAASRLFLSQDDVAAIEGIMHSVRHELPRVIDLGAGSGTTALAVFGVNQQAGVFTVDRELEALQWSLANVRPHFPDVYHATVLEDSAKAAERFSDETVDVLLHDAGHEYDDVHRDILAWWPKLKPGAWVWIHDFSPPPWGGEDYPGVSRACEALVLAGHLYEVGRPGMGWIGRKPS